MVVAAAVLSLLAVAARAETKPDIGHFTLANGLEVVVVPDRRAPVVTHMVWYKVGAADETPGKSGLAHFLEHLMFKGTKLHPIGQFSQTVAFVGGQENAFTTQDYTGYFQRVSRENLKTLMEFESDRMTGLVLTDEAVAPGAQGRARGIQPARRQQSAGAARPSRSRPRSISTIPTASR